MTLHVFTSITSNYLPKARVLANSIKRTTPGAVFHLMLNDEPPCGFDLVNEPFDNLIRIDQLPVANRPDWFFKHSIVELCTSVKGMAFLHIAEKFDAEKIIYLDPDIVVFRNLQGLSDQLDQFSILLTPHLTEPESNIDAIMDNEIASLKHGIYNLGFLGVHPTEEGRRFLEWWNQRLIHFCHDDIAGGLFTDQRWIDLVPAFFDNVKILRESVYNVATWNISQRRITGSLANGILIDDHPLVFYHFSGWDGGAQEAMLKKYARGSAVLFELREWYLQACREQEQQALGQHPCKYGVYSDGTPITNHQRIVYRNRPDLARSFPDPYQVNRSEPCYLYWYRQQFGDAANLDGATVGELHNTLLTVQQELDLIKRSRSWRLARLIARAAHGFR